MEEEVRSAVLKLFRTEQSAEAWLKLRSERLGATPLDLVRAGRGEDVLAELRLIREKVGPEPPGPSLPRWLSDLFRSGPKK